MTRTLDRDQQQQGEEVKYNCSRVRAGSRGRCGGKLRETLRPLTSAPTLQSVRVYIERETPSRRASVRVPPTMPVDAAAAAAEPDPILSH